jgi:hypothetical protein
MWYFRKDGRIGFVSSAASLVRAQEGSVWCDARMLAWSVDDCLSRGLWTIKQLAANVLRHSFAKVEKKRASVVTLAVYVAPRLVEVSTAVLWLVSEGS